MCHLCIGLFDTRYTIRFITRTAGINLRYFVHCRCHSIGDGFIWGNTDTVFAMLHLGKHLEGWDMFCSERVWHVHIVCKSRSSLGSNNSVHSVHSNHKWYKEYRVLWIDTIVQTSVFHQLPDSAPLGKHVHRQHDWGFRRRISERHHDFGTVAFRRGTALQIGAPSTASEFRQSSCTAICIWIQASRGCVKFFL